jgi:hypothetical protein
MKLRQSFLRMRIGRGVRRACLAIGVGIFAQFLMSATASAGDYEESNRELYRGIYLIAVPAAADAKPDIPVMDSGRALETIRNAIDLLYKKSPYNANKLDELKAHGDVVIIYDPGFPEWSRGDITLAAFLPEFFEPLPGAPGDTVFVAMLGRYIIQHSAVEIAAEGIVHELVGHGMQHLHGRLKTMSGLNVECEASLYELQAFQDLGADKFTSHMIRFRRELEERNCDDFKRFMRKRKKWLMPVWDELNVDVQQVLLIFEEYAAQLPK